jgi:hypothetical protein
VDLDRAKAIMDSRVHLRGKSDHALLERVMKTPDFVTSGKELSPATCLRAGVELRPCDAMHLLAYVTRPRYQDDLLDEYARWGFLRYLGFFDVANHGDPVPELKISEAGGRIAGNQRRVVSEEIGIAFGSLLATTWFASTTAANAPISIVDIDAALDDRYVFSGGARHAVRSVSTVRPDYLLIAQDPSERGRYRIRALECKGTKTPDYAIRQLAKALRQLGGITVDGRVPAGLATSMVISDSGLSYIAIDPADEEEPSYDVRLGNFDEVRSFRLGQDRANRSSLELVSGAVSASWATLADFGGNLGAVERWAPEIMRRRLDRRSRDRVSFETPFGTARGTSATFILAGRQFTVRLGIDTTIDQRLDQGAAESIMEAQATFAARLLRSERPSDSRELYSATSDGSIFSLSLR